MAEFEFSYRSSAGEDDLYFDGPLIEVSVSAPVPLITYLRENNLPPFAVVRGLAMIDTGASISVFESAVMEELEIPFLRAIRMNTIHGAAESKCYNASVSFPSLQLADIAMRLIPAGEIRVIQHSNRNVIMLVGRDLLQRFIVTYDGPNAKMKITI